MTRIRNSGWIFIKVALLLVARMNGRYHSLLKKETIDTKKKSHYILKKLGALLKNEKSGNFSEMLTSLKILPVGSLHYKAYLS